MADNIEHQDKGELVTNCDRFNSLKHSIVRSYAFTEHGVAMLSTVLRSETAIRVSIQFPILNISLSNLSSQDLEETHIGDLWDYPGDNSIFEEYYNNQKYVDQSGHIFKIIGKRKSNFINSIIHFNKKELIFEDCGETISFSVLKDFLINRYNSLDDNLAKSVLIRLTKQSKNIKDLIG